MLTKMQCRSVRFSIGVLAFGLALSAVRAVSSQGVAVPNRRARAQPAIRLDRPLPAMNFEDVAAGAGLKGLHTSGGKNEKKYILETTGSGVALIDYDNDGFLDIFLVNGSTLEGFPAGEEPTSYLYRNNGDGKFTDVTASADLKRSGWGQGVCAGDYDNDGYTDLFVTYYGGNVLYRNTGRGSFEDVTQKAGLAQESKRWGTGCSFLDYDKDGRLDLFVANYIDFDVEKTPAKGASQFCMWKNIPVMCGPRGLPAGTNLLYRNRGDGTFEDVSAKAGVAGPKGHYGFTSLVLDYDNDGWPDVYVACDSTANLLYHNNRDGTFGEIALLSGTAFNEDGQEQAGMGAAAADYDGDGYLDIVKTNFCDDTSTLYRNNRDGSFTDATYPARLGVNVQFLGWGTGFFDFDNDGWKDIFIVNGHVYPEVEGRGLGCSYNQERVLYWNLGNGTFHDVSASAGPAFTERRNSRGAAAGDLDNDGSLEIVVNNMNDVPSLLRNSAAGRKNWIILQMVGKQSNRSAIGARVTVVAKNRSQIDEVRSGGSYLSQNDLRLHFGLGEAAVVDRIEVGWPSGRREAFVQVKPNHVVVLEEGSGQVIAAKP
jgi:hypothetical protein